MNHLTATHSMNPAILMSPGQTKLPAKAESRIPRLFDLSPAPPHALMESQASYSVVFNMLGVEQNGIGIDVNVQNREVTVLARKERENLRQGFFWVFGVPADAHLGEMTSRFKAGVLEIIIPKRNTAMMAG